MKTVEMSSTFNYRPRTGIVIVYEAGKKYERVPEAAVREILNADAGMVVRASS